MPELLADHTTLRVGGPARFWVRAETEAELLEAVANRPALVLGGGSNLLVSDEGIPGTVVEVATRGIRDETDECSGAMVTVAAGETWDDLVATAVARGWVGVEALSSIPGQVGSTPIQNVGAYGQEVAQTIASVRCWDSSEGRPCTFAAADCDFGYRSSRFKSAAGRYVVLSVTFQFRLGNLSAPIEYAELARTLGVQAGERAPAGEVREAVLALRRRKGMVLDVSDHDTWSAGSFFTNPIVPEADVPEGAPSWPAGDGVVKTSAAWLIDHAGFPKGYGDARASLSTKHTLALTNRGGASAQDLLRLARKVREGVRSRFGITLVNEPVLVGCSL